MLWDGRPLPKAMLKRIDEQRLLDASSDPAFLDSLTRVLSAFDAYHAEPPFRQNSGGFRPTTVAYFCAEFGVHESLPIYSGASASSPATTARRRAISSCRSSPSACSTARATSADDRREGRQRADTTTRTRRPADRAGAERRAESRSRSSFLEKSPDQGLAGAHRPRAVYP